MILCARNGKLLLIPVVTAAGGTLNLSGAMAPGTPKISLPPTAADAVEVTLSPMMISLPRKVLLMLPSNTTLRKPLPSEAAASET